MFGKNPTYGAFQYPIGTFEGYLRDYWQLPIISVDEIISETIHGDYYFYFRTIYHIQNSDLGPLADGIRAAIREGIQIDGLPPLADDALCMLDANRQCIGAPKSWWVL